MMIDAVSKVNFNSLRFMYESRSQIFMSIVSHPFNVHSHKRKFICDSVVSHQFNVHTYKRKFLCDKVILRTFFRNLTFSTITDIKIPIIIIISLSCHHHHYCHHHDGLSSCIQCFYAWQSESCCW